MKKLLGFTLIEVLIALAIGASIGVLAYQALSGAINIEERVDALTHRINELERVWQVLGDDLRHAVPRPWTNTAGEQQTAMSGLADRLSQGSILSIDDDSHLLRFVRSGEKDFFTLPRSNLQLVAYRVTVEEDAQQSPQADSFEEGDSTQETLTLWRDYWRPVDASDQPTLKTRRLLDGIKTIRVRYLPLNSDNTGDEAWVDGWPVSTDGKNTLPIAIEVTLDMDGLGNIVRLFQLTNS